MIYMIEPEKKERRAHIWWGRDTFCQAYRQGLLKRRPFLAMNDRGRGLCKMCVINCRKWADANPVVT